MYKLITPYASDWGKPNVVIKHFPDTESYVYLPKINSLKNKPVTIYHRLFPEQDKRIFELLLILSRVKKETKNIELFVPYLPNARQDKEHKVGEVVSADVLTRLLKNYGVKKLITYDCHFLPKPGNFVRNGLPIENRSAGKELLLHAEKYFAKIAPREDFCIISPDEGSSYFIENAKGFALKKKRHRTSEHDIHTEVNMLDCEIDVQDKNVCIMDDMIATGGTVIKALQHLKDKGAKRIIVGTTHGVFAGSDVINKILSNSCDELFMTDSILSEEQFPHSLIKVLKLPKI